jgi:hypothetical protein
LAGYLTTRIHLLGSSNLPALLGALGTTTARAFALLSTTSPLDGEGTLAATVVNPGDIRPIFSGDGSPSLVADGGHHFFDDFVRP